MYGKLFRWHKVSHHKTKNKMHAASPILWSDNRVWERIVCRLEILKFLSPENRCKTGIYYLLPHENLTQRLTNVRTRASKMEWIFARDHIGQNYNRRWSNKLLVRICMARTTITNRKIRSPAERGRSPQQILQLVRYIFEHATQGQQQRYEFHNV